MQHHPVYHQFAKQIPPNVKTLTVALSGGVDSVVLLHLVATYQALNPDVKVQAVHVNHGISPHAHAWQDFCQRLCAELTIPFNAISVTIDKKNRQSLEAVARELRYQALVSVTQVQDVILLGQHQDDQVETFFLQLKRGSGLSGLSAMANTSEFEGRILVRPLLETSRASIEAFCQQFNLSHIEDESNSDVKYDRNYLRHQILPELNSRFAGFNQCVARSASLLREQQTLINEIAELDHQSVALGSQLQILKLLALSDIRRRNVLRYWLALHRCLMPSYAVLAELVSQLQSEKADANLVIKLSAGTLRQYNQLLYIVKDQVKLDDCKVDSNQLLLADGRTLLLQQGEGVRAPFADEVVTVQFGKMNSLIKPLHKPGRNTVKHWLKEAKIPAWQRDAVPLVFYNDELVQVVGFYLSALHSQNNGVYWQLV
ncbi:tRNA lysidine(34) synthetase TilS [Pseudoalteromonas tunicata]|uniref:tRNA lysidine(34) synthetase TilS n=1 Tax=Pseudoalteromonas tunicata TaxID=314281 RepID=UPI00273FBE15|nr:tRNA lysidine(34) synthetase TilS [Pseudoalteromonas tunicata]MDP5213063.1 tRNA lysidine(34) synthetase TilS [Pseudoalteromonas tunicata]